MNIETTKITKKGNIYLVEDIEDIDVTIDEEIVRDIAIRIDMEEESIAAILATLEKNRVLSSSSKKIYRRINERDLVFAITRLLTMYDEQALCDAFEDLKYFQILEVMESDDPIGKLRQYDYNYQENEEDE